jgi:archaellum component FlaG (FlaF/FlaG flagellin family)
VSRTIYVKNTGNVPITLSMTTTAWNPAGAAGQITVMWDKESASLNPGQSTSATLTLSVSPSISGVTSFSVNVVVTGSG